MDATVTDKVLSTNQDILSGRAAPRKWTPLEMRRKRRVGPLDCYGGHQDIISSGVFSSRAIELLRPYMGEHFAMLPCLVNQQPHFFLTANESGRYLHVKNSAIKRFSDGSIMEIKRYRFKPIVPPDPAVFTIQQEPTGIFTTASIPGLVAEAGLTGIAFYPLDGNGRDCTFRG